jgi:hypothetical protein
MPVFTVPPVLVTEADKMTACCAGLHEAEAGAAVREVANPLMERVLVAALAEKPGVPL